MGKIYPSFKEIFSLRTGAEKVSELQNSKKCMSPEHALRALLSHPIIKEKVKILQKKLKPYEERDF